MLLPTADFESAASTIPPHPQRSGWLDDGADQGKSTLLAIQTEIAHGTGMSDGKPIGTPYDGTAPESVDSWSRQVFAALSGWPIAGSGAWTRWDPGYLLLEIATSGGEKIEPIFLDSAEGELNVHFGYWEETFPYADARAEDEAEDAAIAAAQAEKLVEQWLGGALRTAVCFRADGSWCGSMAIEDQDAEPALRRLVSSLLDFAPVRIELRRPARKDWEEIAIPPDWLTPLPPPRPRLPG